MNKSHRVPSNRCLSTVEVKSKVRHRGSTSRRCYLLQLGYELNQKENALSSAHFSSSRLSGLAFPAFTSFVAAYFDWNRGSVVKVRWLFWRRELPIGGFVASPSSSHLPLSPTMIQVLVGRGYFGVEAEASHRRSDLQSDCLQPCSRTQVISGV